MTYPPAGPRGPQFQPPQPHGHYPGPQQPRPQPAPGPYPGQPWPPRPQYGPPGPPPPPRRNTAALVVVLVLGLLMALTVGFLVARWQGWLPGAQPAPTAPSGPNEQQPPGEDPGGLSGTVLGAGSSLAAPAMDAFGPSLQTAHPQLTFEYQPVGSGAGRELLLAGDAQFALSDQALSPDQAETAPQCVPIHLPLLATPVVVAFNLPGVLELRLDATVLSGIYQGVINNWAHPAIAVLNPDVALPQLAITPVHRSDTNAVNLMLSEWLATQDWPHQPDAEWPAAANAGIPVSSSTAVLTALETPGSIGYLLRPATQSGLAYAQLGDGYTFIDPAAEEVTEVLAASPRADQGRSPQDLVINIDPATEGVYPLVHLNYLILCTTGDAAGTVAGIFEWALEPAGQQAFGSAGAAPLPQELADEVGETLAAIG